MQEFLKFMMGCKTLQKIDFHPFYDLGYIYILKPDLLRLFFYEGYNGYPVGGTYREV